MAKGKPWHKLAKAMEEMGMEEADYAAWRQWFMKSCPASWERIGTATSDVIEASMKELYQHFSGKPPASAVA